jgi:hypothetical protein
MHLKVSASNNLVCKPAERYVWRPRPNQPAGVVRTRAHTLPEARDKISHVKWILICFGDLHMNLIFSTSNKPGLQADLHTLHFAENLVVKFTRVTLVVPHKPLIP